MQVSGFWWRDWNTGEGFDLLWKGYSEVWIGWMLINYGTWYIIYFGKKLFVKKIKFIVASFRHFESNSRSGITACTKTTRRYRIIIQFSRVFGKQMISRWERIKFIGEEEFLFVPGRREEKRGEKKLVKYCCCNRWFFCWMGFKRIIY